MDVVGREQNSQSQDWQKADARVLGQILAAQNIIFTLAEHHIAEFYAQALITVPGIIGCRVCLGGKSAQAGEMESSFCARCDVVRKLAEDNETFVLANADAKCDLADQHDMRFIAIDSLQHHFGLFIFKIKNANVFDIYQPFIINLVSYVTLSLENRLQQNMLLKAHDELERKVEERTHDLAVTNEALTASRLVALNMMEGAIAAKQRAEQANVELQVEVAERKRAEEALKEQYSTLRGIIDSVNALIFSVDRQYRYTSFNLGHATIMKALYGAEIKQGYNLLDYMTVAEDRAIAKHNLDRALAGEQIVEEAYSGEELRSRRYFQVSHSPIKTEEEEIIGVVVLSQDVTEHKQVEEALYEGQRVFRALVEDSQDIIARYDRDCRRTYVNPVYLQAAQIPQQELLGTSPIQRSPLSETSAIVLQNLLRRVLDSGVAEAADLIWPKADNIDYWYNVYAYPELDREGQVMSVMTISRDITARKQIEEKIRKLNEELEQRVIDRTVQLEAANKELEAFSYSVSHDLRAPLRRITGFIEVLQDENEMALDEQSRHYLGAINESAKEMGRLISDLLSFSRMSRNELCQSQVNLNELIKDVLREYKTEMEGRDIQWQISALPLVTGDRAMLRVVLVNLISNALKFTRTRTTSRIEIGCDKEDDTEVIIFVRDNGVGFDMTYADKLFGVFQRLHRANEFEGTGIGLANVRRIISRHGGKTWAKSEIDKGATFYFTLPRLKEK
jgi:PAS domain S-box-containing protein